MRDIFHLPLSDVLRGRADRPTLRPVERITHATIQLLPWHTGKEIWLTGSVDQALKLPYASSCRIDETVFYIANRRNAIATLQTRGVALYLQFMAGGVVQNSDEGANIDAGGYIEVRLISRTHWSVVGDITPI